MKSNLFTLLHRATALINIVVDDNGASPMQILAQRAMLPQATAYRIAGVLLESGILIRSPRGRYYPGPSLFRLSSAVHPEVSLAAISEDILMKLAVKFKLVAHLGILEDGMVTYLTKAGECDAVSFTGAGVQLEAYCSAIGKVLLAALSPESLDEFLLSGPLIPMTEYTITNAIALREHLDEVRAQNYATDLEEVTRGLTCIAVPIYDWTGRACAAISLSMRSEQFDEDRKREALLALRAAADEAQTLTFGADLFSENIRLSA